MSYYPYSAPNFIWSFIGGAFSMAYTVFIIILVILEVVGRWKMYEKAGEPGWASLIPFYSSYELYKIGWGHGWYFLIGYIPIVGVVFSIMLSIKLARAYGMGTGFAVGLILLPSIFHMILGFGDSTYYGPVEG